MPAIPESEVEAAVAELDKVRGSWLKQPGVTAVDVGLQFKQGQPTGKLAVRVHVKRKLPPEQLEASEKFPSSLGRFPVDVLEVSYGAQ